MVGKVATIAGNAFRESVRQPVFCVVLAVAGGMIAFSPWFSMFTLLENIKLVKDMGLSTILLAGLLLAVLSASNVVSEEIRGRTALMVMARPVGRGAFVLGKFLGIALAQLVAAYLLTLVLVLTVRVGVPEAAYSQLDTVVIWGEVAATALTLITAAAMNYFFDKPFPSAVVFAALGAFTLVFAALGFVDHELKPVAYLAAMDTDLLRACITLFPMAVVLTAAAVACATRLSLVASVVACTIFFAVGTLADYLIERLVAVSRLLGEAFYLLVPNFQVFWVGDALSAERPVPWPYVGLSLGYGVVYTAALLFLAMWLFEKREIQ